MRHAVSVALLCGWIVLSQHMGSNGALWWRLELGPITEAECHARVREATGLPAIGPTKWVDVSTQILHDKFGTVALPTKGSWVTCWPEDVWDKERNTAKWGAPDW